MSFASSRCGSKFRSALAIAISSCLFAPCLLRRCEPHNSSGSRSRPSPPPHHQNGSPMSSCKFATTETASACLQQFPPRRQDTDLPPCPKQEVAAGRATSRGTYGTCQNRTTQAGPNSLDRCRVMALTARLVEAQSDVPFCRLEGLASHGKKITM
jgi:hypothetical protein